MPKVRKRKNALTMGFYGTSELLKKIEAAGGNVENAISRAVARSMEAPKRDMQAFVSKHHVTGATERSFNETPFTWENGVLKYAVGYSIKDGGIAALFLDIGTPKMKPHFFIWNTVQNHADNIVKIQQETLKEIFRGLM